MTGIACESTSPGNARLRSSISLRTKPLEPLDILIPQHLCNRFSCLKWIARWVPYDSEKQGVHMPYAETGSRALTIESQCELHDTGSLIQILPSGIDRLQLVDILAIQN